MVRDGLTGQVPHTFLNSIIMSSSELFAKAAEINNKMNQWVRQKDLIG